MKESEKYADEAGTGKEDGLPTSRVEPLVVHLDEPVLRKIRALAETEGKDHETLLKEFILKGLHEEKKRERSLELTLKGVAQRRKETVEMYTSAGCRGNPGPGHWSAVIYEGPKPTEISGVEENTTNHRMELRAAIEGLRHLDEPSRVKFHSDSAYLVNGMNEAWALRWEKNGWKRADKKPVKNADLWRELLDLTRFHEVEWVKVDGRR